LDRALRSNDNSKVIVAMIAAGLRMIRERARGVKACRDLSHAIKAVGFERD
jgi:hypothetical protein